MTPEQKSAFLDSFCPPYCASASKYEKLAKIGQGTFGEVFKGKDKSNPAKFVAMKKILIHNEQEGFPITALREVRVLQKLNHSNIVNLIEVCCERSKCLSSFYLIFDFCEFVLASVIANVAVRFTLGEIKNVMKQLLNSLYYIHMNKILHRDVKSANVLITWNGVLKLADFGLCRTFSSAEIVEQSRFSTKVVTLWYRPPELLLGLHTYGPSVDIWSAGCIMGEMWTRTPIMAGNTEQSQLMLITQLCGSITPEVWPEVVDLDLYRKVQLPQQCTRKVHERLGPYVKDSLACDLLDKMLALNPNSRIDANVALDHDFFWIEPMPCELTNALAQHRITMFRSHSLASRRYAAQSTPGCSYPDRIF